MVGRRGVRLGSVVIIVLLIGVVAVGISTAATISSNPPANCYQDRQPREGAAGVELDAPPLRVTVRALGDGVVELRYENPDAVESFTVSPRSSNQVLETHGFEQITGSRSLKHQHTSNEVLLRYQVNRSGERILNSKGNPTTNRYSNVGGKVATSEIPIHDASENAEFRFTFPQGGYAGGRVMYIGPLDKVESIRYGCHSVTVVIPKAVNESFVDQALPVVRDAVRNRSLGGYPSESTLFFHPGNVRGYSVGTDGVSGDNRHPKKIGGLTPLHEYIHTRQLNPISQPIEWYREGSATYLTARFLYDTGRISATEFDATTYRVANYAKWVNLTNQAAYDSDGNQQNYATGYMVLASMDEDMRDSGNGSVYDLNRQLMSGNPYSEDVRFDDFYGSYRKFGGARSKGEILALLSDPSMQASPPYQTEPAYILPASLTRGDPEHPPRVVAKYFFIGGGTILLVILAALWSVKLAAYKLVHQFRQL